MVGGSVLGSTIAPDYLVPTLRTYEGAGWKLVVACWGLVGGLESRFPSVRSENFEKIKVFLGFWVARQRGNLPLLSLALPASGAVFFKVLVLKP